MIVVPLVMHGVNGIAYISITCTERVDCIPPRGYE